MTEEQNDEAYERLDRLYSDLHKLVNHHTYLLSPEQDQLVRQKLTDEFRFWRRRQVQDGLASQDFEAAAWLTPDGERVVTAKTMQGAIRDGGATLTGLSNYSVPCFLKPPEQAVAELSHALQTSIWRLEDILKGDDGQAWKEAQKALPKLQETLTKYKEQP